MIAKSYIESNMRSIERLFIASNSVQKSLFYSKLATLELCGWIEMSMDEMVLRTARRMLRDPTYVKVVEQEVKRVYGFHYESHFRKMLIALFGMRGVKSVEKKVNPALFLPMRAELNTLKTLRDGQAHQYIKGTTLTLDAPSVTMRRFRTIHAGLVDIDRVLRSM